VLPQPELEAQRIQVLAALLEGIPPSH
jgi:hypothetical protein